MQRRPYTSQRGFTLVELLVVIGIIALLISILLPTLQKAKAQATLVSCLSNARQIGTGWLMYTNDHKGDFPAFPYFAPNPHKFRTTEGLTLEHLLAPYLGLKAMSGNVDFAKREVAGGAFLCPASGLVKAPTPWYNPTGSVAPGYTGDYKPLGQYVDMNTYAGLYYHWKGQMAVSPSDPTWIGSWRTRWFRMPQGVPVQWCSLRLANSRIESGFGLGVASWHNAKVPAGTDPGSSGYGRPTVFLDGHGAVLRSETYAGWNQNILNANAQSGGRTVHAFYDPKRGSPRGAGTGLPGTSGAFNSGDFALSEY